MGSKYTHVFEPFTIRGVTFKNRIINSPGVPGLASNDGCSTPQLRDYHAAYARGGAAVVTIGNASIDGQNYRDESRQIDLTNPRTWISLNGQVVPYYVVLSTRDDSSYTVIGRVPALLNGETDCNMIIKFTSEDPEGSVVGISTVQNYKTPEEILGKIEAIDDENIAGSTLEFLCDLYGYDSTFDDQYELGDTMTLDPEEEIEIYNIELEEPENAKAMYKITDVYGNEYWTPEFN